MSDTRRRRQSEQSAGSDDLSGSTDELNASKEIKVIIINLINHYCHISHCNEFHNH